MCGIGGVISISTLHEPARLHALRDAMRHRCPDGFGSLAWDADGAPVHEAPAPHWLVHRRLSILDLSEAAAQPMPGRDGACGLSFNGEIFNFQDLRDGLDLRSSGDTEVLRALLERDGVAATLPRLNGMFAFAWMEPARGRLSLVRDRLGQKPLFYAPQPDGGIAFASEIPALLAGGFAEPGPWTADAVDAYWTLGYIPAPLTLRAGIRQVRPGHVLTWENGNLREEPYWRCTIGEGVDEGRGLDDLADELENLLGDAIRLRLIADVPVGLFLSGGIDSSLICALARRDVHTFTIGFDEAAYDESAAAAAVAAHLGLSNRLLRADAENVSRLLHDAGGMLDHFGQPLGDASCLPTYLVCALARQHVTVALSGDGGDELFAGYTDYREGLGIWGERRWRQGASPREALRRPVYRHLGPARGFARWAMLLGPRHRRRLFRDPRHATGWAEGLRRSLGEAAPAADPVSVMQHMDLHSYLPDDILVKLDRCSMAVGLEARSPFLDFRVVEFAARLPFAAKFDEQGRGKRLLRHLLARHVPPVLWDRPKQGFAPPWRSWKDLLGDGAASASDPWLDPAALAALRARMDQLDERLSWSLYAWQRMC